MSSNNKKQLPAAEQSSVNSIQDVLDEVTSEINVTPQRQSTNASIQAQSKKAEQFTSAPKSSEQARTDSENDEATAEQPITTGRSKISDSSRLSTDSVSGASATSVEITVDGNQASVKIPRVVLSEGWTFKEEIGRGGFAKVFKVTNQRRFPNKTLACKMFDLRRVNSSWARKHLTSEMKISKSVVHKNVMSAIHVMKTTHHAFIFMELASNGTISHYMFSHKKRPLKEALAQYWLNQVMAGLCYLHSVKIVHRDLKLDNFLLDHSRRALITDFGFAVLGHTEPVSIFAKLFSSQEQSILCETVCGTPEYVAPEVHLLADGQRYNAKAVDIYAMGVCLFEMVNMVKPFQDKAPFKMRSKTLVRLQQNCQFTYNPRVELTKECCAVITSLMNPDPKARPTAEAMLKNKWLIQ